MKAKKMYLAPKMERVDVEIEAPIAYSGGGGSYYPTPGADTPGDPGL